MTVNVNFPEAAVQQATDDYVQDLYKEKEKGRAQPSPKPSKISWSGFLLHEAFAAESGVGELKIKVDSPKAHEIRDRQIARLDKIHDAKAAGQLGETNTGFLSLEHGGAKLAPALKTKLEPLVDVENKDRKALYDEILVTNGYTPSRLIDLEKSFSRSFQAHSASGTWLQDETGKWSQKP